MNSEIEKITAGIIQLHFDLTNADEEDQSFQKIRMALSDKIESLINEDFEKLLQILYRIDVDEDKAKGALAEREDQSPSEVLAGLVIERLMEKAITRINNPVPPGDLNE